MDLRSLPTDEEAGGMMEMLEFLQPLLGQPAGPAEGAQRERPRPPLDTCFSVDEFVRPGPSSQGHRVEDAAADWNTPAAPDGGEPADWKTRGILNTVKEGDDDEIRRLRGLVDPRLHGAARAQDVEAICELLAAGASPAALDWEGRTPLHLCVADRLIEPLMVLLSVPGSADVQDASGWPLLHAAILHGWRDGARAILGAGVRVDASGPKKIDFFDLSPVVHYKDNRYPRVNFLKFLESLHRTVIEVAIITDMAMLEPILSVARENGVVDCLNIFGHTALHTAVWLNKRMAVDALLRSGASPHRVSDKNDSVLHPAVHNPQMIMYLLEKTDVKSSLNDAGHAPEHIAVSCRELETLKLLLGKSKDIRMKTGDEEQNTLLHLAAIRGDDEIANIILYRDAELEQAAGLALALRVERDAAEREAAEQDAGTRDAAERETAEQDAGTGDAAERETAEQDAGTGDAAERETAEQDAGTRDAAGRETAEQNAGTRDAAGRETAEQNAGTRDAPEQNAAERVTVEQNPAEVDPLERVDYVFEVNAHGETPLHLAAKHNNKKLAALFLLNGANLSTQTEDENKTTVFKLISNNFYKAESFFENIFDGFIYNENMFGKMSVNLDYGVLAKGKGMSQIKVLEEFVNCDQSKLLIHPLIQSLLYLKWKHFQPLFIILLCIYGAFLAFFNILMIYVFYLEDKSHNSTNTSSSLNDSLATDVEADSGGSPGAAYWVLIVLTYLAILTQLLQESMFIYLKRWSYFPSWETAVKLSGLALCVVTPPLVALVSGPWPRHIACAALLLVWLQAMFLVSRLSRWGYYVLMFGKVALNILKILVTAIFLVIAFAFCFMVQFQATSPFDDPFAAFVKTLVMMTSEFDYEGMFKDHDDVLEDSKTATRILFVIFVIFVAIVLMNFMTGVAVSDINDLNETGKIRRAEKQVELLSTFEPLVYDGVLAKWFIKVFGDRKYHSSISTERGHKSTWRVKVRKYPYKVTTDDGSYDIKIRSSKLFNALVETPGKQEQADIEAAKNNTEKPYRSRSNAEANASELRPRGAYQRSVNDDLVSRKDDHFNISLFKQHLEKLVSDSSKMSDDVEALKQCNENVNMQISNLSGVSNDILRSVRRDRALARMTRRRRRCAARTRGQRLA